MNASPPMPVMFGSVTLSTAAIAMAASTALPPRFRMSRPVCDASGWLVATMPWLRAHDRSAGPRAGEPRVLRLGLSARRLPAGCLSVRLLPVRLLSGGRRAGAGVPQPASARPDAVTPAIADTPAACEKN